MTLCEFHWGTAEAPFSGNGSCWGLDSWGLEVSGILKQPGILYTIFAISQGGDDVCIATRGMLWKKCKVARNCVTGLSLWSVVCLVVQRSAALPQTSQYNCRIEMVHMLFSLEIWRKKTIDGVFQQAMFDYLFLFVSMTWNLTVGPAQVALS